VPGFPFRAQVLADHAVSGVDRLVVGLEDRFADDEVDKLQPGVRPRVGEDENQTK
jgi:hypothetical protein